MKKVLAMVLCLVMVLTAMSVTVFAADEVKIINAVMDPTEKSQGKATDVYDGKFNGAFVYGWNDANAKRTAVVELEKAVTLEDCYITWGHPSWATTDMAPMDYTLEASADGEEYTEIYSVTDLEGLGGGKQRTDTIVFETSAENVKFVRLTVTRSVGHYLGISEIRFNKGNTSTTATSSAAASSEETSSVEETSSEAVVSEEPSSEATSSEAVVSEEPSSVAETSSVAESSAATTDNEPKSMTWLWIVLAVVAAVVVVVIVLTSKKKK